MNNTRKKSNVKYKNVIKEHIINNFKLYFIIFCIFLIGLVMGIIFINRINDDQYQEIANYLQNFIESIKQNQIVSNIIVLKEAIKNNLGVMLLMWFLGLAVIGLPFIYVFIFYKGFCLGYTLSAMISVYGSIKGIVLGGATLFFHNLIIIPILFIVAVSGQKTCKSIIKDKRKDNIKQEVTKHTAICLLCLIAVEMSAVVEAVVSCNLLKMYVNYI